jgi:Na(+)-translocating NADH:ubiquinone oxidoreductase A subunit
MQKGVSRPHRGCMGNKHKRVAGGYRFTRFSGQPEPEIADAGVPPAVTLDLRPVGTVPVRPLVEEGEPVSAGRIIARDDEALGNPVLATVNGKVEEIRKSRESGQTVVIRSDGTDSWKTVEGYSAQWKNLGADVLEKLVYLSGAAGAVAGGIPTRFNSAAIEPRQVEHILLQVVPAEVFNPAPSALLAGRDPGTAAEGLAILSEIMPDAAVHLVGGRKQRSLLQRLRQACRHNGLEQVALHAVGAKYPNHREEVLIPAVLGEEYPHGYSALNLGVLVIDLQALLHVRDAVVEGKPAIQRVVALGGGGFSKRPHLRVRIGASLEEVLDPYLEQQHPRRIVRNSLLTGDIVNQGVVDPLMAAVIAIPEGKQAPPLAFSRPGFRTDSYSRTFLANFVPFAKTVDTNLHGEHRPCIACTYCDSVCPAGILPHLLHRYVQRDVIDETLVRLRIFDCIDCNLCTYVCTSKIPLAQLMRKGKEKLEAEGLDPRPEEARSRALRGVPAVDGRPATDGTPSAGAPAGTGAPVVGEEGA